MFNVTENNKAISPNSNSLFASCFILVIKLSFTSLVKLPLLCTMLYQLLVVKQLVIIYESSYKYTVLGCWYR